MLQSRPAIADPVSSFPQTPIAGARLYSATGFFIRHDGTLVTVAHGVEGCHSLFVGSEQVSPVAAYPIRIDPDPDVALLRAPGFPVQATLTLAALTIATEDTAQLEAFGFPPDGRVMLPNTTRPLLLNARVRSEQPHDPRYVLWLQNRTITHGWSGGPVMDVGSGQVVGMTLSIAPGPDQGPVLDIPASNLALAVGGGTLTGVLNRAGVYPDKAQQPPESIGRAVVRIFCWR